jgi:hypothetical protein
MGAERGDQQKLVCIYPKPKPYLILIEHISKIIFNFFYNNYKRNKRLDKFIYNI